jgi:hypothetical protein
MARPRLPNSDTTTRAATPVAARRTGLLHVRGQVRLSSGVADRAVAGAQGRMLLDLLAFLATVEVRPDVPATPDPMYPRSARGLRGESA